jgi:hypothetical protein
LVPSALPLLLLIALGLARFEPARWRAPVAMAGIGLLGLAAVGQTLRPPEEKWDALVRWVEPRVGAGEEVWLLPNELVLPMSYAGGGGGQLPLRGIPASFPAPDHPSPRYSGTRAVPAIGEGDAQRLVGAARSRGVRGIWLVSRFGPWFDRRNEVARALGTRVEREGRFAPLIVEYYALAPAIPPPG